MRGGVVYICTYREERERVVEKGRSISIAQDRLSAIEDEGLRPPAIPPRGQRERSAASNNARISVVGEPTISGYRAFSWPLRLYYWPCNYC